MRRRAPVTPLTHHEILALVAPFARRGLHVDLPASRREERILAFKPQVLPADDTCPIRRSARLTLEAAPTGSKTTKHRLTRVVWDDSGLEARLSADGRDLDLLLEQLEQVPVERQFVVHADAPVARSYLLEPATRRAGAEARQAARTVGGRLWQGLSARMQAIAGERWRRKPSASTGRPATDATALGDADTEDQLIDDGDGKLRPILVEADTRIGPLRLNLKADRFGGMPVELKLTPEAGVKLKAPEDLLAVIGWHCRPLRRIVSYWRGSIKVATQEPARTPDIESKLRESVEHLAETFSRSPREFHQRHLAARWRVTYQRSIPMLFLVGIMAATPGIQWLDMADNSILRMLIFHAPPLMLIGFFLMREMPRFEIPPLPRQLMHRQWFERVTDKSSAAPTPPSEAPSMQLSARRPAESEA